MFKTTLTGNTGGYVNFKKIETENGTRDQLQFTIFAKDRNKKIPVFCVWTSKDLSEVAKYLMIPNTKEDSKTPYCSRFLVMEGRFSIQEKYQELEMADIDDEGDVEYLLNEEGKVRTTGVMAPSIVLFVDWIEFLDKTPGEVKKTKKGKVVSDKDLAKHYRAKAKTISKDIDESDMEDTEEVEEQEEVISEKKKATKKAAKKKTTRKDKEEDDIETLSADEILSAIQG